MNIHNKFHHKSQKNMTKLLVPKLWVYKKLGDGVVDHVRHLEIISHIACHKNVHFSSDGNKDVGKGGA